MTTGEETHHKGIDGAQRAKRWLEGTTRVVQTWMNPEDATKLTFSWATTGEFSFDLGGTFWGDELHNKNFFVECKKYKADGDQGTEYRKYLAKCYLALKQSPGWCDHFMWITWAPFSLKSWEKLLTTDYVAESVRQTAVREKTLGDADGEPDLAHCADVASRLWLIVLSDKQEVLRLSDEERGELTKHRIAAGSK